MIDNRETIDKSDPKAVIINQLHYNYNQRDMQSTNLEFYLKQLSNYDIDTIYEAVDIIANDESVKYFPKVFELKIACRKAQARKTVIKANNTDYSCQYCHGKGYVNAYYEMFGINYDTIARCSCENANPGVPVIMFNKQVKRPTGDKDTPSFVNVIYRHENLKYEALHTDFVDGNLGETLDNIKSKLSNTATIYPDTV